MKAAAIHPEPVSRFNTPPLLPDHGHYLYLRADRQVHKIDITKIRYIEALDDYLRLHIEGQKKLVVRMTMKGLLKMLPEHLFARTHRSYIVSINSICGLRTGSVMLADAEVPLSQRFVKSLKAVWQAL